jgi:hypothetical protein
MTHFSIINIYVSTIYYLYFLSRFQHGGGGRYLAIPNIFSPQRILTADSTSPDHTVTSRPSEAACQLHSVAILHIPNYTAASRQPQPSFTFTPTDPYGGTYMIKNYSLPTA